MIFRGSELAALEKGNFQPVASTFENRAVMRYESLKITRKNRIACVMSRILVAVRGTKVAELIGVMGWLFAFSKNYLMERKNED